ncbi:MAG: curved DNA-binding protein CbpA [Psychroserpens sp.]|jgi:curved DNA-binding protein CbpA
MNLYEILGINKDSPKEEIKKSYRLLSKTHHPDVGGDKDKFNEISEAYKILMDDETRGRYDNGENIGDILKPKKDRVVDIITGTFNKVIHEADIENDDIIEMVKKTILMTMIAIKKDILQKEKQIKKFNTCLRKIKHKKANNLLSEITKNNIVSLQLATIEYQKEAIHLQGALDFMDDFNYDLEEKNLMDKINDLYLNNVRV